MAIGRALYNIGSADYLRTAILSTECKACLTPTVLGWWGSRNYRQLTNQFSARLSPQARTEFQSLANGQKYVEQLKQNERIYIIEKLETYMKNGAPMAFACGIAYAGWPILCYVLKDPSTTSKEVSDVYIRKWPRTLVRIFF